MKTPADTMRDAWELNPVPGIKVSFEDYDDESREVEISSIEADFKGIGLGTLAMTRITSIADDNGINLMVLPIQNGSDRLRRFYGAFDFDGGPEIMRRRAKRGVPDRLAEKVLMFVHEGFVDDFLASKKQGSGWDQVAGIAEGIFEKPNQLKWFLLLFKEPNDAMGVLKEFEHFMSLPIPAIKEFSPGNMSYWDVLQKFKKWEEQWRVKQDRYIHHAGAFRKEGREYSPMVVLDFKDGFVWMDLRTPYSEIESKAMGHCGNEPRSNTKDTILSLRQKIKRDGVPYFMPHATLVLMKNGFLRELKGYQNHKIASKYFPYVVELLKQHPRIKGIDNSESYKPSEDFYWYDLTPEQIDDIVRAKPVFSKDPVVKAMVQRYTGYVKKDRYNKYYMRDGRVEWGILPDDLGAPTLFFPSTSNGVFEISDPEILDRGTYYVRNGKFHREDGPAVIRPESPAYKHGEQGWYRDGNYYRENGGPHEEAGDGTKHWYTRNEYGEWKVDKVEHPDGSVDIWRDGRRVERRSPGGDSL